MGSAPSTNSKARLQNSTLVELFRPSQHSIRIARRKGHYFCITDGDISSKVLLYTKYLSTLSC